MVPVGDGARRLRETLESLRAQSFEAWECLVVDGGAVGGTADTIRGWSGGDPRIRRLRREGAGTAAARNQGVERAGGPYVAFLEPGQVLEPDALAWQVAALDGDRDAVLVHGDAAKAEGGPRGRPGPGHDPEDPARADGPPRRVPLEELLGGPNLPAPLVRRTALRRSGGFDTGLPSGEERDMWLRLARTGAVLHRPRVAVRREDRPGDGSSDALQEYRCARAVLERHLEGIPASGRSRRRREAQALLRSGYGPRLREEALRLERAGRWPEARERWRTLAPGGLDSPGDLARAAWAFLPTDRPPSLGGMGWAMRRLTSPAARHRATVEVRARARRVAWRGRARRLRAKDGEAALVGIALVDHMGDLVAAEPVARHLRARHPDAILVWVVRETYRSLPEAYPEVDEVWSVSCLTEWIRIRSHAPFDHLVDLHVPGRSCGVCQVALRRDDGDPAVHLDTYYGEGDLLEVFCRSAGLPVLREGPRIRPPAGARRAVDRLPLPEAYVCIHGRSTQAVRDWRDDGWPELARRVTEATGLPVVEVGLDPVLSPAPERVDLCGALSILETAEVLRRARLFVGIDSGPAHLANAVGTPGVLLMGRYRHWERYRPWAGGYGSGETAEVLWADGPASTLEVDRVAEAVLAALAGAGAGKGIGKGGGR